MEPITVTLPDPATEEYVRSLVAGGVYPSARDYLISLVEEDRKRRMQERLEALLLEGLEGEEKQLTAADWEAMRRAYEERHAARRDT